MPRHRTTGPADPYLFFRTIRSDLQAQEIAHERGEAFALRGGLLDKAVVIAAADVGGQGFARFGRTGPPAGFGRLARRHPTTSTR